MEASKSLKKLIHKIVKKIKGETRVLSRYASRDAGVATPRFPEAWLPEEVRELRCPRCDAPAKHLHPAIQFEGEVIPCNDRWHSEF